MGVTQAAFAKRLGVSLPSIKIWELGKGLPHSLTAALVAKRLGMDAGTLLGADAVRTKAIHCPGIVAAARVHGVSRQRVWMLATGRQRSGKKGTVAAALECSGRFRTENARLEEKRQKLMEQFKAMA